MVEKWDSRAACEEQHKIGEKLFSFNEKFEKFQMPWKIMAIDKMYQRYKTDNLNFEIERRKKKFHHQLEKKTC